MKKIFSIIMILVTLVTFAACDSKEDKESETAEKDTVVATAEADEKDEAGSNAIAENVTKETVEFSRGIINGDSYENEYFDLGFDLLDATWSYATDEEIAEAKNITAEMLTDDWAELLEDAGYIQDMMAMGDSGNVNIIYEKTNQMAKKMTDEVYMENAVEGMKDAFEGMGVTDLEVNIKTMDFAGREDVYCAELEYTLYGVNLYQASVLLRDGDYVCNVTATAYDSSSRSDLLDAFYEV